MRISTETVADFESAGGSGRSAGLYLPLGIPAILSVIMDVKEAGRRGGQNRAKKLDKEQRIRIARNAAQARWAKVRANRKKRK